MSGFLAFASLHAAHRRTRERFQAFDPDSEEGLQAAFAFNGSWCVNVYKGMNPNLKYGAMLPPAPDPSHSMRVWGGTGTSFMVNAQSPRKDAAIRFLRWLTEEPGWLGLGAYMRTCPPEVPALKIPIRARTLLPTQWRFPVAMLAETRSASVMSG